MSKSKAMELLLQSSPLTTLSSSSSSRYTSLLRHPFLTDQNSLTFSNTKRCPNGRKLMFPHFRAQALESIHASTKSGLETTDAINQESPSKDENVVFVAGATGKVGSRTVRELLKLGFQVRAGVRSAQRAETLVQSVQQLKLDDGASAVEKLEIVECDLERDRIEPAIANAFSVICCIGASEKEIFDVTGPYRIDYQATKNLIDAATVAGVNHFILLTSLGTNKVGFPAAILNLFWGVLIWKRKAEEALIASGLPYTIVRPGGMERPTDAYKETHNVSLAKEDTLFGGQVSNLQVAELLAFMTKNPDLSYCKVVEVIAETTAPLRPFEELLSKLPSKRVGRSSWKSIVPVATSSVTEKEPIQAKVPIVRPSSYILYKDLETPASPTPTPSTSQAANVNSQETEIKPVPSQDNSAELSKSASDKDVIPKDLKSSGTLSPFIAYDDLKPPSSPTPAASNGGTKGHLDVVQEVSDPTTATSEVEVPGVATTTPETISTPPKLQDTRPLSPYFVYEDLKPPTSPTPTKPKHEAVPSSSGGSIVMENLPTEVVEETLPKAPTQKTSYLSPFPMYEDLKPPSSPIPSAPIY